MANKFGKLLFAICVASLGLSVRGEMTNSLTYAASFGKFDSHGTVVGCDVNGKAEMTVALYASQEATQALWCRRYEVDVVDDAFVVVLSDAAGRDVGLDELEKLPKFAKLSDLFLSSACDAAFWVEISNVTVDGEPLPDAVLKTLPRGKIAAAPFAVVAGRAEASHSSFRVHGKATVTMLKTTGSLNVPGTARFEGGSTFRRLAQFGDGLTVTGTVSKTAIDDIGTLRTAELVVSSTLAPANLTVTGGDATVLMPSSGFTAPSEITVADELTVDSGLTVGSGISAVSLKVDGKLTLTSSSTMDWAADGTLRVPEGVYEPDDENKNLAWVSGSNEYSNTSGKDALFTLTTGYYVYITTYKPYVQISGKYWATYGTTVISSPSAGYVQTMLVPVAPGEKVSAYGLLSVYHKELSK